MYSILFVKVNNKTTHKEKQNICNNGTYKYYLLVDLTVVIIFSGYKLNSINTADVNDVKNTGDVANITSTADVSNIRNWYDSSYSIMCILKPAKWGKNDFILF
jgi:hypothetical protein